MIALVVSLLAVAGFGAALWATGIAQTARSALSKTTAGVSAMMDPALDDDAKEVAVRRAGLALIGTAFGTAWRLGLALLCAAAPIYGADAIGLVPAEAVFGLMLRLDYIAAVTLGAVGLSYVVRRMRPAAAAAPAQDGYSAPDRLVHAIAFASPAVLRLASRLEDRLMPGAVQEPSAPPIFITSLARGGTTAVLNALHDVPGLATHRYRDMPFVSAPCLWAKLGGGRARRVQRQARAHGDGLEIDLETPEAFEEIFWRMDWPEHYGPAGIRLWDGTVRKPEAEAFLRHQMAKIVHARRAQGQVGGDGAARYCSKNNANIARIPLLRAAFPGCRMVIPLRRPEAHAASLWRQHANFCARQDADPFVARYMRDLGHFEFGRIHAPLLFPGFDPGRHDPNAGVYWLDYWVRAISHVLQTAAPDCLVLLQDDLRAAPDASMGALCDALGLQPGALGFKGYFRGVPDGAAAIEGVPAALRDEAEALYARAVALARRTVPAAA